jgi:membrane protein
MRLPSVPSSKAARHILAHPLGFALQVLRAFNANQGMMLAGAIAYYALLSMVPLLILSVIALSHWVNQSELLSALGRYLEWLVPSQSKAVLGDIQIFLDNRVTIGVVLLVTMLFFSSLAFGILEKAMGQIFVHRELTKKRHKLVSAILPYCFVLALGIALLVLTVATIGLQALAQENIPFFGYDLSLVGVSGLFFYLIGFAAETLIVASIYLTLPVGRMPVRHALLGGLAASSVVQNERGVWLVNHRCGGPVLHGNCGGAVADRRAGHSRIRAPRKPLTQG